jgi:hypothetical protein
MVSKNLEDRHAAVPLTLVVVISDLIISMVEVDSAVEGTNLVNGKISLEDASCSEWMFPSQIGAGL